MYFGSGWDFIATNFDVAVLDRGFIDPEAWKFYISSEMVEKYSNELVILVDNQPQQQNPPFYNIKFVDLSTTGGIENIIGLVKNNYESSSKHQST